YVDYGHADPWSLAQRAMTLLEAADADSPGRVAAQARVTDRWLRKVRAGTRPGKTTDRIIGAIVTETRLELEGAGWPVPGDVLNTMAAFIRTAGGGRVCRNCRKLLASRLRKLFS